MTTPEYFTLCGSDITTNSKRNLIRSINKEFNTSYGSILIDPSHTQTYLWTFKIHNNLPHGSFHIGISKLSRIEKTEGNFAADKKRIHFSYGESGKKYSSNYCNGDEYMSIYNDTTYHKNEFLSMKLQFDDKFLCGSLYFATESANRSKNYSNKLWMIAFNNIPKTQIKYQMAVSLKCSSVELIDFTQVKHNLINHSTSPRKSVALTNKNGTKNNKNKNKKRIRSEIDNSLEYNINEPPLKKRRKQNTDINNTEQKSNVMTKIRKLFETNKKYVKERKEMVQKIETLEKSNAEYREVIKKMVEIFGTDMNNNINTNSNNKVNSDQLLKQQNNNINQKHLKQNECAQSTDKNVENKKRNQELKQNKNTSLTVQCMGCYEMVNDILNIVYCSQCGKVYCNKNTCKLVHVNIHKQLSMIALYGQPYNNYQLQQSISMQSRIAALSRFQSLANANANAGGNLYINSQFRNNVIIAQSKEKDKNITDA